MNALGGAPGKGTVLQPGASALRVQLLVPPSLVQQLQTAGAKPLRDAHVVSKGPGAPLQQAVQETAATISCLPAWG